MSTTLNSIMSSNICVSLTLLILYYSYSIDAVTYYQDCGGHYGKINTFIVEGCDMKPAPKKLYKKFSRPSMYNSQPITKLKPSVGKPSRSPILGGDPCIFKLGKNTSFYGEFTPDVDSDTAQIKVWGYKWYRWFGLEMEPDACKAWQTKCPLVKGVKNIMNITLPIKAIYPEASVGVEAILYDQREKEIMCVYFDAVLQK